MRATSRRSSLILFAMLALTGMRIAHADPAREAVDRLVADYIGLYAGPTLDRWQTLFHPAVVVAFPADDGSITTRGTRLSSSSASGTTSRPGGRSPSAWRMCASTWAGASRA